MGWKFLTDCGGIVNCGSVWARWGVLALGARLGQHRELPQRREARAAAVTVDRQQTAEWRQQVAKQRGTLRMIEDESFVDRDADLGGRRAAAQQMRAQAIEKLVAQQ